jgi:hypothetical protein
MALADIFDITVPCYNGHLGLGTQVTVISRGDCMTQWYCIPRGEQKKHDGAC